MDIAAPNPRKRRPGRPLDSASAAGDARELLLDAALACYLRDGIKASSLSAIAKQAGVTPAMLHYYFGDKSDLLDAVVQSRLLPVLTQLGRAVHDGADTPHALIEQFVSAVLRIGDSHPWLPSLWVREVLSEGGALRGLMLESVAPLLPRALAQRFADAQQRGQLPGGLDPRLLVVSLLGLTLFPLAAAPIWRSVFRADDIGQPELLRHTLTLLQLGLETTDGG